MHPKVKYEGPWSDVEKTPGIRTGEWRYQRPVTRAEKCCQCALCYIYCPTGSRIEKNTFFAANLDYCKGCGVCASSCPRDAIRMVPEPVEQAFQPVRAEPVPDNAPAPRHVQRASTPARPRRVPKGTRQRAATPDRVGANQRDQPPAGLGGSPARSPERAK